MAKQPPKAQISGSRGRPADGGTNAFHFKQELGSCPRPHASTQRGGHNVPFGAPGGRALPITLMEWGADVALDERADGPLVLKWP
jgi:hypothetical protein